MLVSSLFSQELQRSLALSWPSSHCAGVYLPSSLPFTGCPYCFARCAGIDLNGDNTLDAAELATAFGKNGQKPSLSEVQAMVRFIVSSAPSLLVSPAPRLSARFTCTAVVCVVACIHCWHLSGCVAYGCARVLTDRAGRRC
jgi:hypothetical protein